MPGRMFDYMSDHKLGGFLNRSKMIMIMTFAALAPAAVLGASEETDVARDCTSAKRIFNPEIHKTTYYVGVHAPGGVDNAWAEYNLTFQDYLTATAGQRFVPPIEFKMKTTTAPLSDWVDNKDEVDFIYSDTGAYSCVGVEIGAEPLATTVSHVKVRGHMFDLDMFAGVIFTRADNDDIDGLEDLKDKVIGALAISDFAGGQVQFYAMHASDQDYIMDPKQVIFTDNQVEIVKGVLNGDWEVGFVRTGQIEKTVDENGKLIDADLLKVLEPRIYVLDDGNLFPFLHSTPAFPEWPFAATNKVPRDVVEEVQDALIKLQQHKTAGEIIHDEYEDGTLCRESKICDTAPPEFFYPGARCDTTREIARIAYDAAKVANHNGFRPPRSYFQLRSMQQEAGFLKEISHGKWQCTRAEALYDGIDCPVGHYKLNRRDFEKSCDQLGLPCPVGHSCYCKPCIKAYEMDVYEYIEHDHKAGGESTKGCDKMGICGTVEQTKTIVFRARDNKERENAEVTAVIHENLVAHELNITKVANESWTYEFNFTTDMIEVGILEVYVNGEQVPQSPYRVRVVARNCEIDYPGKGKKPTANGDCECGSGTIPVAGDCLDTVILAVIITIALLVVASEVFYLYLKYKRKKGDEMWHISLEELHFDDPVQTIGQGSFGVVLLAEYRGTKVAIKRAIPPPNNRMSGSKNGSKDIVSGSKNGSKGITFDETGGTGLKNVATEPVGVEAYNVSKESNLFGQSSEDFSFLGYDECSDNDDTWWRKLCPALFRNGRTRIKKSILTEGTVSSSRVTLKSLFCPWCDKRTRKKKAFLEEMRLLSRLRHPCITTVMGAVISHGHDPMLVMEYMDYGSLYDLIHSESMFFSGEILLQITRDIAQGLRYLHASKPPILHGDLKSKNILIDSRFRAKVCDFGLSTKRGNGISGTPFWMAPEYLRGKSDYNTTCDMYSVGIIVYELYSRKDPYKGESYAEVLRKVCDPRRNYRPDIPECCPPRIIDLMKKLWSPDPFFRPQAKDLDTFLLDMNAQDAEPLLIGKDKEQNTGSARLTKEQVFELFPKHIATAMENGLKVEPEQHEMVTVVFADVFGFDNIARRIEQFKVSAMLDRTFHVLDHLAKKYDIFKVETIGEGFMAVANLEGDQDNTHAKNVAEFAMDAIDATCDILIDDDDPKEGHVRLCIGLHSGPVVGNVIGSLHPRYALFGDTVSTASRLESNSLGDRILCSEKSAMIVREQAPDIKLMKRGKITVKGKGKMTTFWIGSRRASGKNHSDMGRGTISKDKDASTTESIKKV